MAFQTGEVKEMENPTTSGYSMEARFCHSRYDDASETFDKGRLCLCREKCHDLLHKAYLPLYTKCQTLQLLACCSYPHEAKRCLEDALFVCSQMTSKNAPILRDYILESLRLVDEKIAAANGEPFEDIPELEYDKEEGNEAGKAETTTGSISNAKSNQEATMNQLDPEDLAMITR